MIHLSYERQRQKKDRPGWRHALSNCLHDTQMVSLISLHCNKDILFTYNQSDYDEDIHAINIYSIECPCCGAVGFFSFHAYYFRHFSNSSTMLKIQRIRCQKCKSTHALLPEIIIPYRYFSSPIILKLFSLYLKDKLTVSMLKAALNISRQSIEKLIAFYFQYHNQLLYIVNPYLKDAFNHVLQREYFMRNHFFFMQSNSHKHRHNLHMEIFT